MRVREIITSYRFHNVDAPARFTSSPDEVAKLFSELFPSVDVEHFLVFNLNAKNEVMSFHTVSKGIISQTVVAAREVFKTAIMKGATSVVVAHNHPSEVLTPSNEDVAATRRLLSAGEIIGIPILDHVIVNTRTSNYLSFKLEGFL